MLPAFGEKSWPVSFCIGLPRPTISLDSDLGNSMRSYRRGGSRYVQRKECGRWGRGRLARTKPGTMEENPVKAGLVRLAGEWPWMGGSLQE